MRVSSKYGTNKTVRRYYLHEDNDKKSKQKIFSVNNKFKINGNLVKLGKNHFCLRCEGRICCPEPNIYTIDKWKMKEEIFNMKNLSEYLEDEYLEDEYLEDEYLEDDS
jgi:hypothetical protein